MTLLPASTGNNTRIQNTVSLWLKVKSHIKEGTVKCSPTQRHNAPDETTVRTEPYYPFLTSPPLQVPVNLHHILYVNYIWSEYYRSGSHFFKSELYHVATLFIPNYLHKYSLLNVFIVCIIIYLFSTLTWLLPNGPPPRWTSLHASLTHHVEHCHPSAQPSLPSLHIAHVSVDEKV